MAASDVVSDASDLTSKCRLMVSQFQNYDGTDVLIFRKIGDNSLDPWFDGIVCPVNPLNRGTGRCSAVHRLLSRMPPFSGALVSAAIHLFLAPSVIGISQIIGVLFYLNGLGWIGGVLVFLSRFWRREFYLVATGYALVTIIAFFVMGGDLEGPAIAAKIAEGVVVVTTAYLYTSDTSV